MSSKLDKLGQRVGLNVGVNSLVGLAETAKQEQRRGFFARHVIGIMPWAEQEVLIEANKSQANATSILEAMLGGSIEGAACIACGLSLYDIKKWGLATQNTMECRPRSGIVDQLFSKDGKNFIDELACIWETCLVDTLKESLNCGFILGNARRSDTLKMLKEGTACRLCNGCGKPHTIVGQ